MKVVETKILGVLIIDTDVFGDHRGYFTETYNKPKYEELNIPVRQHRKSGRRETVCPGLRKPLM